VVSPGRDAYPGNYLTSRRWRQGWVNDSSAARLDQASATRAQRAADRWSHREGDL